MRAAQCFVKTCYFDNLSQSVCALMSELETLVLSVFAMSPVDSDRPPLRRYRFSGNELRDDGV